MKKIILSIFSIFLCASATYSRAENIGVPSECEDVMLQAFYWDSYKTQSGSDSKYGRTKWIDLLKDTAAINANFGLVWFPPSASSTGGVGYYHACLSNQESAWGTRSTLETLIAALHKGNTKVLADIVINHRGNKSNWCDFYPDNFGTYGTYQLTKKHMCRNDEGFTSSGSTCYNAPVDERGEFDTGTNDGGCRDLDHTSEYVQTWAKAYVRWMLNVMHYDGFRYDMTLGYHGRYLSMYNEAANPYISVSELWEGTSRQVQHLQETDFNTMIFDFPLKSVLNNAIGKYTNYGLLVNPSNSLRAQGYGKYAVTFIDNHDTFERGKSYGDNQYAGEGCDLTDPAIKKRVVEAYAYILMLPGVPCVFWPHWKRCQDEINALIAIRKEAGIHSESAIVESKNNNVYEATIQGHRYAVILRMGPNRSTIAPAGYHVASEGGSVAAYTIFMADNPQGMEEVQSDGMQAKGNKFIRDGRLCIRKGEKIYDILGNEIK